MSLRYPDINSDYVDADTISTQTGITDFTLISNEFVKYQDYEFILNLALAEQTLQAYNSNNYFKVLDVFRTT